MKILNQSLVCLLLIFSLKTNVLADVPVLIFAGQSNMTGYQADSRQLKGEDLAEQPNVYYYGDDGKTWGEVINLAVRPTQQINAAAAGFGFGPEAVVGKNLVEAKVFPKVLEIKYVMNGSGGDSFLVLPEDAVKHGGPNPITSSWNPNWKTTPQSFSLYHAMLDRVEDARRAYTEKTGEKTYVAGFFWMQGESDAYSSPAVAELYDKNLKAFVLALRKEFDAPDMPFVYGRIRDANLFPNDLLVRKAQDNVVTEGNSEFVTRAVEIDTDSFGLAGDNVHFSSEGVMALGRAMAKAFQKILSAQ